MPTLPPPQQMKPHQEAARPEDRQDLPTTSTTPTGSVTSKTTGQTSHPPILLAGKQWPHWSLEG